MDLKQYFRKIRNAEANLADAFPLIISLETPDGGKAGIISEVTREIAAKLIVEGSASLANDKQREAYYEQQAAEKKAAEKAAWAHRVQVSIVTDPEPASGEDVKSSGQLPNRK